MKATQIVTLGLVFCAHVTTHAQGLPAPRWPGTGKVIDTVVCKTDPTQSYALYIPVTGNSKPLPVVYFFDPHASGAFPLNKYKSLADAFGFIIIGSNNSKNGNDWPTVEKIWRCLLDDTQNRLKINPNRVYACGFSGGAKVAGWLAMQHPVIKGVIANGAGLPDGTPARNFNFSFTAIAGEGDLNFTDLVAISNELDKTQTRHRLVLFDGKHEWAPAGCMNTAFAGLQFDAMQQGLISRDIAFINGYVEKSKKSVENYGIANQPVKAVGECALSISFLEGLTDQAGWFKAKAASLVQTAQYKEQQQARENILVTEQNTKTGYMQHFQQADMPYWTKTINDLRAGTRAKTAQSAMCQRLLAWLSLAFYSYSNHLLNSNANNEARYFVALYKMADPSNSEAWYFSAILHAREQQAPAAENDLMKAVDYGFRDMKRLHQQPEFQQLSGQLHFSRIENGMHAALKSK